MKRHVTLTSQIEYEEALKRMENIFDADPNTKEGKEAELLALSIEEYEGKYYKIELPDPIDAMRIKMEEMEQKRS